MLMLKKTHDAMVARILAIQAEERTKWRKEMQAERETVARMVGQKANHMVTITSLKQERDSLLEDKAAMAHDINDLGKVLATHKAERERRMAPLIAANAARAAASAAKRAAAKAERDGIPY